MSPWLKAPAWLQLLTLLVREAEDTSWSGWEEGWVVWTRVSMMDS